MKSRNLHPDILKSTPRKAVLNSWFPIWSRALIVLGICVWLSLWLWGLMPLLKLSLLPESELTTVNAKVVSYRRVDGRSPSSHITLDYEFQGKRYVREVDSDMAAKSQVNQIVTIKLNPSVPSVPVTNNLGQFSPFWGWAFKAFLPGCWLPMAIGCWFSWVKEPLRKKGLVENGLGVSGTVKSLNTVKAVHYVKYCYSLPGQSESLSSSDSLDAGDYGPLAEGDSITVLVSPDNPKSSAIYPNEWKIES